MVDFPVSHSEHAPFPWRSAALAAGAVAAIELLLLLVVGGALIAKPAASPRKAKARATATQSQSAAKPAPQRAHRPAAADLPRRKVTVLILNGNGRNGAAAAAASRVDRRGYRIGKVGNAPQHDYPRSLVMYRRGFEGEGVRLARDMGIKVVGPLDGMRPRQLQGAHAVMILGG